MPEQNNSHVTMDTRARYNYGVRAHENELRSLRMSEKDEEKFRQMRRKRLELARMQHRPL